MNIETVTILIGAFPASSESLALIPGMKSNSLFQLIFFVIKSVVSGIRDKEV